ncbi:MAG: hypothetical protein C6W56_15740 [Caldibacillus debilis]|nr:MAG: hypothetical protein C6W56_15740 [Caldibacillus debilis]
MGHLPEFTGSSPARKIGEENRNDCDVHPADRAAGQIPAGASPDPRRAPIRESRSSPQLFRQRPCRRSACSRTGTGRGKTSGDSNGLPGAGCSRIFRSPHDLKTFPPFRPDGFCRQGNRKRSLAAPYEKF